MQPSSSAIPVLPALVDLWPFGCAGALLGMALALCGLISLGVLTAAGRPLPPMTVETSEPDLTVIVQEEYLTQVLGQALPGGVVRDLHVDVQPGNQLALNGRIQATILGRQLEGDLSAMITLTASNGRFAVGVHDVSLMGLDLPGFVDALVQNLSAGVNNLIDRQIRDGLGDDATIVGLDTDDQQVTIQARWQP